MLRFLNFGSRLSVHKFFTGRGLVRISVQCSKVPSNTEDG